MSTNQTILFDMYSNISYNFISQSIQVVHCMDPKKKGMVTAIWKREFHPKSVRLDHDQPEQFVRCQVSSC